MAGHNPHGRLGQQNPPWNHLQVPSFIPRQPQLAHMSNEPRPLNVRSSPLAWHTPAHNEAALYNYMTAATHKTPLDINPLLPAFVRPPNNMPFGSVDLSLGGSSSRNNSNASPRNLTSPANAMESNFPNHSMIQSCGQTTDMNHQQSHCNGDNRVPTPSHLLGNPAPGSFSQLLSGTDMSHMMHTNYHPLHDSLQLVKEAIQNSLRHETGDDSHEFHELQRAISNKPKTPISNHLNSETERIQTPHRSPVNITNLQLPPPPQLAPTHQTPTLNNTTTTNQRSPSSALHHSNSSCSSSSSSTSSSSATSAHHQDPTDDKAQTRRRSRKPIKTTRLSNNSEDGEADVSQKSLNASMVNDVSELIMTDDQPNKSSAEKVQENGTNQKSWTDDETNTISLAQPTTINEERNTTPANLPYDLSNESPQQHQQQHPERRKSLTPPPPAESCPEVEDSETIDNIAAELAKTCHENGPRSPPPEPAEPKNAGTFALTPVTIPLVPVSLTDDHTVSVNSSTNSVQPQTTTTTHPIVENGVDTTHTKSPKVNGVKLLTPSEAPPPSEAIFKEVENKLEEMFAGIEDDRTLFETASTPSSPVKATNSPSSKSSAKKTSTPKVVEPTPAAKRKRAKPRAKKTPAAASTSKGSKGKKSNAKQNKATANKSNSADKKGATSATGGADNTKPTPAAVRSGPIVHVDHSGSTHVINGPVTEEVAEVKAKLKKGFIVGHHHPAGHASDRSKIRGLHCSTLSTKYDADTTDTTWMCVFCKMGPHRLGLGDLFGPYIVSTACDEFQLSQSDPMGDLFSSHHKQPGKAVQKRSLPMVVAAGSNTSKKKRKLNDSLPTSPTPSGTPVSNPSPFFGMAKASDTSFEVWMHGDCAVWSSGVHIIGTRIVGLEAAVWTASGHRCTMCQQYGAMLSCLQRGCKDEVHVPCARLASWRLCDDDFKSRCSVHSVKAEFTASTSANTL